MFKSKTVFIVGAGASREVGLPTGEEIKLQIKNNLNFRFESITNRLASGSPKIAGAIQEYVRREKPEDILQLRQVRINTFYHKAAVINEALPHAISIDNLLDAHAGDKHVELCGKFAIIQSILDSENKSSLRINRNDKENAIDFWSLSKANVWFSLFVRILAENVTKEGLDKIFDNVTFLSFNYDRCIEHYLYHSLMSYYSLNEAEIINVMKNFKIHYLYGNVGCLPWKNNNRSDCVSYGCQNADMVSLVNQIKTFTERKHEENEIAEIRSIVQSAEVMVFLGFAFHRQNLELLKPRGLCKAKRIFATGYGISNSDREVLELDLEQLLQQTSTPKARVDLRTGMKCSELFLEYWRSLTTKV